MRKVILSVAVSLDSFIEGPNGEYDWCFTDGDYGLSAFFKSVDTIFMGRKSYEMMLAMGNETPPGFPKLKEYIFSTTLEKVKEGAILLKADIKTEVEKIKNDSSTGSEGKNIWLFGGAGLASSLINLSLVDEISLAVHPIILGSGKPMFKEIKDRNWLTLTDSKIYPNGLVMLTYTVKKLGEPGKNENLKTK